MTKRLRLGFAMAVWGLWLLGITPVRAADEPVGASNAAPETQADVAQEAPHPEPVRETAEAVVANGERGTASVPVVSWRDLPFQTVKRQAYDYSCGSAAVATLLSYVYGARTSETDVFKAMFDAGDQDKIRLEGFSLLDMSAYLNRRGFKAVGYRLDLARMEKAGVPFIALVDNDGYHHFVVVKSVRGPAVLVGDPNKGNVVYARAAFEKTWSGVALVVMNHAQQAKAVFADAKDWRWARYPVQPDNSALSALNDLHEGVRNTQIAPTGFDIMTGILNTTGGLNQIAVQAH